MSDERYGDLTIGNTVISIPKSNLRELELQRVTPANQNEKRLELCVGDTYPELVRADSPIAAEHHSYGRLEQSQEAMTGVALGVSMGFIGPYDSIGLSGAGAQDRRGSGEYVAAHRVTRTVTARGLYIPDSAWNLGSAIRDQLWLPYKATDLVPIAYNHGDSLFEHNGGADAFRRITTMVAREQLPGRPLDHNSLLNASQLLKREFLSAFEKSIEQVRSKRDAAFSESYKRKGPYVFALECTNAKANVRKPAEDYITVKQYLEAAHRATKIRSATLWTNPQITSAFESMMRHSAPSANRQLQSVTHRPCHAYLEP